VQEKPFFAVWCKLNYINMFTVKLYAILKVNNSLVKSVYSNPLSSVFSLTQLKVIKYTGGKPSSAETFK
jgi:hypothetical protein